MRYFSRVSAVVPDSAALRTWLGGLKPEAKRSIRVKRHPWLLRRMLIVSGRDFAGDRLVRDLVEQFGSCRWSAGRWHVDKAQLSLFPSTRRAA